MVEMPPVEHCELSLWREIRPQLPSISKRVPAKGGKDLFDEDPVAGAVVGLLEPHWFQLAGFNHQCNSNGCVGVCHEVNGKHEVSPILSPKVYKYPGDMKNEFQPVLVAVPIGDLIHNVNVKKRGGYGS